MSHGTAHGDFFDDEPEAGMSLPLVSWLVLLAFACGGALGWTFGLGIGLAIGGPR